jgi:hypothetical protein
MAARRNLKLSPCFFGSFQVIQQIIQMAYKLDLPPCTCIYPVFHVSCLNPKLGKHFTPLPTLPPVDKEEAICPKPEAILQRRMHKQGNCTVTKVLVKWQGTQDESATWQLLQTLQQQYRHLVSKAL